MGHLLQSWLLTQGCQTVFKHRKEDGFTIDSIVEGLETDHVRPLTTIAAKGAILVAEIYTNQDSVCTVSGYQNCHCVGCKAVQASQVSCFFT